MDASQAVTETVILRLKESTLSNLTNSGSLGQTFDSLSSNIKAQPGSIRQRWGPQVETPELFVWCIDWRSHEAASAFVNSNSYELFTAGLQEVFDIQSTPPLRIFTRWTSDAKAALDSEVTEVAFFALPNSRGEETKAIVDDSEHLFHVVTTYGKATGAALGWIFEATPKVDLAPSPGKEWLHGVFGYHSIDDHMKWRQHPEHDKIVEASKTKEEHLKMVVPEVPGIDHNTGWFHVKFRTGI